ncbi:MAG: hypothetical protein ABSH39_20095 [Candidatus Acidiferrum sp.]
MKLSRLSAAFLGGSLLLCASVFAGTTNKRSIHLTEPITVAGKQLPAGDYKVEWTESADNVQLNFIHGKDVVATLSAKVISVKNANARDGYETTHAQDGTLSLKQIFFSGKTYDLEIQTADNAVPSSPSGSN